MSLEDITTRLRNAAENAGRNPDDITLIAVSKRQEEARIREVLEAGHRVFGENQVQEAQGRWPDYREEFEGVKLHLIGPLQSNKVNTAFDLVDAFHALDREKIARKFADKAQEAGRSPDLFIQVNTGEEPQKAGVLPSEADDFIATCRGMDLPVKGLMVIPPVDETPSLHFALLAKIAKRNGLDGLSMGMSDDFEEAIALGATHIRVGSAIFGKRAY
ncbi:YggS family pyridoxal phosphate-dependent enzyme [Paracoccaceae bacterium GXU_MW_L88]